MEELMHYGIKRKSGRYPWGSGENPYQHENGSLYHKARELEKQGLTEKEIADFFGMTIREYRAEKSRAKDLVREENKARINDYISRGWTISAIAKEMDIPESTVRVLSQEKVSRQHQATQATIDVLAKEVKEKTYIDVGRGTATRMGITDTRLDTAVQALKSEGYELHTVYVKQAGSKNYTTVKVLCAPGVDKNEVYQHKSEIGVVNSKFEDQHSPIVVTHRPVESLNSNRLKVVYGDEGGADKDGLIEIRRGVKDLDLGESRYAQVRIAIDGTHYVKGMAVYSDDLPDGIDVVFNTNKKRGSVSTDMDALKEIKGDLSNPSAAFATSIKAQKGCLNIVNEEGDWQKWSKTIASQVLSKQPVPLARKQLEASRLEKQSEYEEIMSLTNDVVKEHLLMQYANKCDAAAENLKAAAVPRQASHVILPVESLKANEIYAPGYKNGETVILIRYPHGGTFEIPELKVNNLNSEAKRMIGSSGDAVCINHEVASRLSGADFDGDTVLVIPNNDRRFVTSPALKELEGFEPKLIYARPKGTKPVAHVTAQTEMGVVTNLITDMTIRNASPEEIARAVKYSMVVIDAEKHNLDWRQAKQDNGIYELQQKYQVKQDGRRGGASTLISRASAEIRVPEYKKSYKPNPDTGKYEKVPTGRTYIDKKTGKKVESKTKSTQMAEVDDAYILSSGTQMEAVYADYANSMKEFAASARRNAAKSNGYVYKSSAAEMYKKEVDSLNSKLKLSKSFAPLERKAQILAETYVDLAKQDNPEMTSEQENKIRGRSLAEARISLNAVRSKIDISAQEWEAIQSGAITKTKLKEIMNYCDQDRLKFLAMPKDSKGLSDSKITLAKSRLAAGYTLSEVADSMGISVSTLKRYIYQ